MSETETPKTLVPKRESKRYTEKDMVEFATQWAAFLIVSEQKPSIVDFLKTFNEEREKNENNTKTEYVNYSNTIR